MNTTLPNTCLRCGLPAKVKFCTRSCANAFNNALKPKRPPEHSCKNCGKKVNARNWYCSDKCKLGIKAERNYYVRYFCKVCEVEIPRAKVYCFDHGISKTVASLTMGEYKSKRSRDAIAYNSLRAQARTVYKNSGRPSHCNICQYSKHFEVCHIIDLCKFADNQLVAEVNSLSNLIALCPNHHWEFDNDVL